MRNGFCPACHQPVSLPELASDTLVRCPVCRAEHPMVEFARAAPPAVEVVVEPVRGHDPSAQGAHQTPDRGGRAVGPDSAGTSAPAAAGAVPQQFDFAERLPSPAEMAPLILTAGKHAPQRRHGLGGAVKVVLGGLLGAVLAQLIVWWLPHPYRTDPFELAPRLPDRLKWIAPLELQFQGLGQLDEVVGDGVAKDWESDRDERVEVPEDESLQGAAAESSGAKKPSSDRRAGLRLAQRFSGVEVEAAVRDAVAATTRLYRSQNAGATVSTDEWSRSLDQLAYRLAAADPQDRDVVAQRAAVEKLIRSIDKQPKLKTAFEQHVLSSWQRWSELTASSPPTDTSSPPSPSTSAATSAATPRSESSGTSAGPSAATSGGTSGANSGGKFGGNSGGAIQGGWIAGRVDSIGPRGSYFESMVRVSSAAAPVAVLTLADPTQPGAGAIGVGDQVVVGGLTLVHPAADLSGYDGPDRPALWAGITIPTTPSSDQASVPPASTAIPSDPPR